MLNGLLDLYLAGPVHVLMRLSNYKSLRELARASADRRSGKYEICASQVSFSDKLDWWEIWISHFGAGSQSEISINQWMMFPGRCCQTVHPDPSFSLSLGYSVGFFSQVSSCNLLWNSNQPSGKKGIGGRGLVLMFSKGNILSYLSLGDIFSLGCFSQMSKLWICPCLFSFSSFLNLK